MSVKTLTDAQKGALILETERPGVRLQILKASNVSPHYPRWLNDTRVNRFMEMKFKKHTQESCLVYVDEALRSGSDYLFGIFLNDKHIGCVKLGNININHEIAEVSFLIGNAVSWGCGIGGLSVRRVCEFGFNHLGLRRIYSSFYSENAHSSALLRRIGFSVEGVRRSDRLVDGVPMDLIQVGLLAEEFLLDPNGR